MDAAVPLPPHPFSFPLPSSPPLPRAETYPGRRDTLSLTRFLAGSAPPSASCPSLRPTTAAAAAAGMDSDWEDADDTCMLGRDAAIREERMRTLAMQEGIARVGDEGVEQAAAEALPKAARAAHVLGVACGIEDAVADLYALLGEAAPVPTAQLAPSVSARHCLFKFRKAVAGEAFKKVEDVEETNLPLLCNFDSGSAAAVAVEADAGTADAAEAEAEAEASLPEQRSVKTGLLFVQPGLRAARHSAAMLECVK
eukprot:Rhum_TRINITY_DN14827_c8_g3::Rhum_TRINITY_DN14827_c8_g3_i1::g.122087::m.122087